MDLDLMRDEIIHIAARYGARNCGCSVRSPAVSPIREATSTYWSKWTRIDRFSTL